MTQPLCLQRRQKSQRPRWVPLSERERRRVAKAAATFAGPSFPAHQLISAFFNPLGALEPVEDLIDGLLERLTEEPQVVPRARGWSPIGEPCASLLSEYNEEIKLKSQGVFDEDLSRLRRQELDFTVGSRQLRSAASELRGSKMVCSTERSDETQSPPNRDSVHTHVQKPSPIKRDTAAIDTYSKPGLYHASSPMGTRKDISQERLQAHLCIKQSAAVNAPQPVPLANFHINRPTKVTKHKLARLNTESAGRSSSSSVSSLDLSVTSFDSEDAEADESDLETSLSSGSEREVWAPKTTQNAPAVRAERIESRVAEPSPRDSVQDKFRSTRLAAGTWQPKTRARRLRHAPVASAGNSDRSESEVTGVSCRQVFKYADEHKLVKFSAASHLNEARQLLRHRTMAQVSMHAGWSNFHESTASTVQDLWVKRHALRERWSFLLAIGLRSQERAGARGSARGEWTTVLEKGGHLATTQEFRV